MAGRGGEVPMHWDLDLLCSPQCGEMDMKATLRCHAHVSRFFHRGTTATRIIPALILPVGPTKLGPEPKNGGQAFPTHSSLDYFR